MTKITNEQKREIRQFAETYATLTTDFLSHLWETLSLDTPTPKKKPRSRLVKN